MFFSSLALFVFFGCASQESLNRFNTLYYDHSPQEAYDFAKKEIKGDKDGKNLLWEIQAGVSAFSVADYKDSVSILENAEIAFNKNHEENIASKAVKNTGAVLLNDNVKNYEGYYYEGALINYYKALDSLALDDKSKARVEFNRANDRQRRAKEFYEKEIKKATEEAQQDKNMQKVDKEKTKNEIDKILSSEYSNLDRYGAYDGFVNPLISYVSGLYFSLEGDSKGIDLLKEAYGVDKNKFIGEDMLIFQNRKQLKNKYTWVIIEDGKSPIKKEVSFKFPIITSDGVYYFGLALPQLVDGESFYDSFVLKDASAKNPEAYQFEPLVILDGVIANEFKKELPYIMTRAIISATTKVIVQGTLNKNVSPLAGLAMGIFTAATTAADTRITSVFPHKVWLNRIENNTASDKIIIEGNDGKKLFELDLMDCSKTSKQPEPEMKNPEENPQENAMKQQTQDISGKICKNSNNIVYLRTTKNNIIFKSILGEKQ
ncbi:hypothetical protein BJI48_02780 [Helicobacter sp. 11S02596-1]|nr:hypothetical protein BJI48_02780 [Helicobacter sp. 11S02596-1]